MVMLVTPERRANKRLKEDVSRLPSVFREAFSTPLPKTTLVDVLSGVSDEHLTLGVSIAVGVLLSQYQQEGPFPSLFDERRHMLFHVGAPLPSFLFNDDNDERCLPSTIDVTFAASQLPCWGLLHFGHTSVGRTRVPHAVAGAAVPSDA